MYDPTNKRFTAEDTHWKSHNRIFGDAPTNLNSGVVPDMYAMMQSNNLYSYCINNPNKFVDLLGNEIRVAGTEGEKYTALRYLQKLTDHELGLVHREVSRPNDNPHNHPSQVVITQLATENIRFSNGNELLERMINNDSPSLWTTITIGSGDNAIDVRNWDDASRGLFGNGVGSISTIHFNPEFFPDIYVIGPGGYAVREEVPRPAEIGLIHEIIHADRAMRGAARNYIRDFARHSYRISFGFHILLGSAFAYRGERAPREELETIGLLPPGANAITENMIRQEHGLPNRARYFPIQY